MFAVELRTLRGNDPLLLDGTSAWIVESGSIALFSVETIDGALQGRRRFLIRLDAGSAFLGCFAARSERFGIIAVAVNRTQVRSTNAALLIEAATRGDTGARRHVASWAEKLLAVLNGTASTNDGTAPAELPVSAFHSAATLTEVIADLESRWVHAFESEEGQRLEAERARLLSRRALNENLANHAINELASVLAPSAATSLPVDGTLLFRAVQAVAESQGIVIRNSTAEGKRSDPLQTILQASGVRARRVVLAGDWWAADAAPLLGFIESTMEPVALLPSGKSRFSKTRYEVFNPADNSRVPVTPHVLSGLASHGFTLYRPLGEHVGSWDFLKFVLRGRGKDLLAIVLAGVATTCLGMVVPQATSILVDQAIPDADRGLVFQLGLALAAAAAGSLLFEFAQAASMLRLEIGSSAGVQCGVWDRLLKLSPAFFRKYTTGDLSSRAGGINNIRQQLGGATLRTLFIGITALLNLALMLYYSPALALIAAGLALIVLLVTIFSSAGLIKMLRLLQEIEGRLLGLMVQLINGVPKLRVAAAEERAFAHWGQTYSRQQKLKRAIQRIQDRVRLLNLVLPALSSALIFWVVEEVLRDPNGTAPGLALGTFLAFNTAFGTFFAGATSLSDTGVGLLGVGNLWKRARVILDAPPEVDSTKVYPGRLTGRVTMEHVTFRYRDNGPMNLDDVSIEAGAGECIAIVGPSGGGKSTLLSLLLRFENPLSGAVYYDGHDLNSLDIRAVRRQLGVVLQDNKIMAGSIYENIVCGSLCTLEDAWEAARAAAFDADINQMPMKMHTPISEGGGNISGGQRQRLLIARALVSKPAILIFDEATSAIDNRTQAKVTESLRHLKVTTILVAHRLSTIRHADRIYVMEAGRVVQQGTFDELLVQEGLFARLMARQKL